MASFELERCIVTFYERVAFGAKVAKVRLTARYGARDFLLSCVVMIMDDAPLFGAKEALCLR